MQLDKFMWYIEGQEIAGFFGSPLYQSRIFKPSVYGFLKLETAVQTR
jgi:hypothetical protein